MQGAPHVDRFRMHDTSRTVPDPSTPQGGQRRYLEDEIAAVNVASGAYTKVTTTVRIKTPSARLATSLSMLYDCPGREDATAGMIPWTADISAWKRTKSGLLLKSNSIITGLNLPFTWDAIGTADEWRAVITAPNAPGTSLLPGRWIVTGTWEPAPGSDAMPEDELQALFRLCHVQVDAALLVSQTGA